MANVKTRLKDLVCNNQGKVARSSKIAIGIMLAFALIITGLSIQATSVSKELQAQFLELDPSSVDESQKPDRGFYDATGAPVEYEASNVVESAAPTVVAPIGSGSSESAKMVDLKITDISFNANTELRVTVENGGDKDVESSTQISVKATLSLDGKAIKTDSLDFPLTGLQAQKASTYTLTGIRKNELENNKVYYIQVEVLTDPKLNESDEKNNVKSLSVETANASSTGELPDLMVNDVFAKMITNENGVDEYNIFVQLKNAGKAAISAGTVIDVEYIIQSSNNDTEIVPLTLKLALEAGGTTHSDISINKFFPVPAGSTNLSIVLDRNNKITESNEDNNSYTGTKLLDIPVADLVITKIEVDSNNYLKATIQNDGTDDANTRISVKATITDADSKATVKEETLFLTNSLPKQKAMTSSFGNKIINDLEGGKTYYANIEIIAEKLNETNTGEW